MIEEFNNINKTKDIQVGSWNPGERLKVAREYRKVTQTVLARAIGVTQAQLSQYETGANKVPLTVLRDICLALRIDPAWFLGFTNTWPPTEMPEGQTIHLV